MAGPPTVRPGTLLVGGVVTLQVVVSPGQQSRSGVVVAPGVVTMGLAVVTTVREVALVTGLGVSAAAWVGVQVVVLASAAWVGVQVVVLVLVQAVSVCAVWVVV